MCLLLSKKWTRNQYVPTLLFQRLWVNGSQNKRKFSFRSFYPNSTELKRSPVDPSGLCDRSSLIGNRQLRIDHMYYKIKIIDFFLDLQIRLVKSVQNVCNQLTWVVVATLDVQTENLTYTVQSYTVFLINLTAVMVLSRLPFIIHRPYDVI